MCEFIFVILVTSLGQIYGRGAIFLRNCGAALVGEYNRVI